MIFSRTILSKTILYKCGKSVHVPTDEVKEYLEKGWSFFEDKVKEIITETKEDLGVLDAELEQKVSEVEQEVEELKEKVKSKAPWVK